MGRRGPKTTPTALKVLRGNPRKEKLVGTGEPKPPKLTKLRAPKELNKEARKVWRDTATKLSAIGLLTEVDTQALIRYCDTLVRWRQAKDFLDKHGFYYPIFHAQTEEELRAKAKPKLKYMAQYPHVNIYTQLSRDLTRLEAQFGMTPSSRASLGVAGKSPGQGDREQLRTKLYG